MLSPKLIVARKVPPMARPSFREEKRALVAKWKFMVACGRTEFQTRMRRS